MNRLLITLAAGIAIAASASTSSAQTVRGTKTLGITAGYVTNNESAAAGLKFSYAFSRHFALAPSVDCVFPHQGKSGLLANIDCEFPLAFSSPGNLEFYPIAGVNFTSWRIEEASSSTLRDNRLGLNLGAGLAWYARPALRLSVQGKYNMVKHDSTGIFLLGIAYVF